MSSDGPVRLQRQLQLKSSDATAYPNGGDDAKRPLAEKIDALVAHLQDCTSKTLAVKGIAGKMKKFVLKKKRDRQLY